MTTETILTNQEISDIWSTTIEEWGLTFQQFEQVLQFARAIEQTVLQSAEIQSLRKDAERYRATRAGLVGTDPDYGSRFCAYCDEMGIKQAENITEEQFDAATDAAMEQQT